jgi:SAM-dependent methyltransferase
VSTARDVFMALHEGLPKQAPGSDASTERALALVGALPPQPAVLDLGAGPGRHTLVLARRTQGRVVAIDLERSFLRALRGRAAEAGLAKRVHAVVASMDRLGVAARSQDLLWCEGAAYAIGFDRALALWRPLLRGGGGLALTELSWLTAERTEDARRFWEDAYPAMRSLDENRDAMTRAGYRVRGVFALPASDWWDGYYDVLASRIPALRERHAGDRVARATLDGAAREIEVFSRSGGCYGYAFFVAARDGA